MSARQNIDHLMMDALDGCISAQGRATLEEYLSEHPAERIAFEQMQRVDHALCVEPLAPAPRTLKLNVMAAITQGAITRTSTARAVVTQLSSAQPARMWLTAPQAVFLAMVAATLAVVIGIGAFVLFSSAPPTLAYAASPATGSILGAVGYYAQSIVHVLITLIRALFSQGIAWIVMLATLVIASLWARVVLMLLLPALRLVLA